MLVFVLRRLLLAVPLLLVASLIVFAVVSSLPGDPCADQVKYKTPETIRDVFRIDAMMGEVGGVTVVVPRLKGEVPHRHFDDSGGFHEHTHEVDDHVYDHDHGEGAEG